MPTCLRLRERLRDLLARRRSIASAPADPVAAADAPELAAADAASPGSASTPPYSAPVRPMVKGDPLPVATSGYGRRHASDPTHWAIDVSLPVGWRYRAVASGVVVRVSDAEVDPFNGCGVWYRVDGDGPLAGRILAGIHLGVRYVEVGQEVAPDQVLGLTASTGASTGPHLHWEIDAEIDPMDPQVFNWKGAGWTWEGW